MAACQGNGGGRRRGAGRGGTAGLEWLRTFRPDPPTQRQCEKGRLWAAGLGQGAECSPDCVELEVASDVQRPAGSWLYEAGIQERGLGRDQGDHARQTVLGEPREWTQTEKRLKDRTLTLQNEASGRRSASGRAARSGQWRLALTRQC